MKRQMTAPANEGGGKEGGTKSPSCSLKVAQPRTDRNVPEMCSYSCCGCAVWIGGEFNSAYVST